MKIKLLFILAVVLVSCQTSQKEPNECCSTKQLKSTIESYNLPGTSLYHLTDVWKDQHNKPVQLQDYTGKNVIMTMFFTHCAYACPMLVSEIKAIESNLTESQKSEVIILLISFDDERDTPDRLKEYATTQGLSTNWKLLHGNKNAIQTLSVALGISYDLLENGQYAHSNRKVFLDKSGSITFTQDGLGAAALPMSEAIKKLY